MGMNIGRGDNIMREMAWEVNLTNHDLQQSGQAVTPKKRKAGMIACCALLAFIVLLIALFILL